MKRVLLLLLAACGPEVATDDFTYSTEEWALEADTEEPFMFLEREDDTNGPHICGSDNGFSGAVQFWRFQAPAKYTGNASRAFGRRLTWDAKTNAERQLSAADLFMSGRGLTIVVNVKNTPVQTTEWRQFSVPLSNDDPNVQWYDEQTNKVVTNDQIKSVLSTLKSLRLPGEWVNGGEQSCLDNVYFGTP